MNWSIIWALISKDFSLYFRNRFFTVVTVIGIIAYLAIYFVMPKSVDENLEIGLYAPVIPPGFEQLEEGLEIQVVESEAELKEAVISGRFVAGIKLPVDILDKFISGEKPRISVYFASDVPEEMKGAIELVIGELAYRQTGQALAITMTEEILGPDMIGMPIPPRDRMRPLFAILLILTETFGMANLIREEIERRTMQALLVTPMTVKELFTAKGIVGISLAFGQAILFMGIVGGLGRQPLIILVTLLLGAVLVTGIAFLIASLAKDMMSVMAWGVVTLIPLIIPSAGVMFPGAITGWVKIIPSYYLVDTVHLAANFGAGWSDVWTNLLILMGFNVAIIWIGIIALRRKS